MSATDTRPGYTAWSPRFSLTRRSRCAEHRRCSRAFWGVLAPLRVGRLHESGSPTTPQGRNAKAVLKWKKQRDPDRLSRRSSRATGKKAVRSRNPRIGL